MDDDIYQYLKLDHKKVAKLFDLYESSTSEKNKFDIIEMLNKELTLHAVSEEEIFYKALAHNHKSKKEALHGEKEHQQIKGILSEIIKISTINNLLDAKIQELKKIVEHHVSEEEGEMFKEAKEVFTTEEAYVLKEKMHFLKGKLILSEFPD